MGGKDLDHLQARAAPAAIPSPNLFYCDVVSETGGGECWQKRLTGTCGNDGGMTLLTALHWRSCSSSLRNSLVARNIPVTQ
jgi:hypothetical protein